MKLSSSVIAAALLLVQAQSFMPTLSTGTKSTAFFAKANPWKDQNIDGYEADVGGPKEGPKKVPWKDQSVDGYEIDVGLKKGEPGRKESAPYNKGDDTPTSWSGEKSPRTVAPRDKPAATPWKGQNIDGYEADVGGKQEGPKKVPWKDQNIDGYEKDVQSRKD